MAKKILNVATLGLSGLILKPFGKKKPEAAPAPAPAPQVMPLADDEQVRLARKRAIIAQQKRAGRSSTILSDSSDKLGS